MERLSHDLALALEESSNCGGGGVKAGAVVAVAGGSGVAVAAGRSRQHRRVGLRRRTRSTGNIPTAAALCPYAAAAAAAADEEGEQSSSSAHGGGGGIGDDDDVGGGGGGPGTLVSQRTISDDDSDRRHRFRRRDEEGHHHHHHHHQHHPHEHRPPRQHRGGCNFESDSFNENCFPQAPSRPPNARRKRKFKKMAIDCAAVDAGCRNDDDDRSAPQAFLPFRQSQTMSLCFRNASGASAFNLITKKKKIIKHDCHDGYRSGSHSGKRKWSHRERSELGEMRERSFSGGCASKIYFRSLRNPKTLVDFKNADKYLEKIPLRTGLETALQNISLSSVSASPSLPGSSSFNFVYRPPAPKPESGSPFAKSADAKATPKIFSPQFFVPPEAEPAKSQPSRPKKHGGKSHGRKHKGGHRRHKSRSQLRNPLQFDAEMDCSGANDVVASSSSISSSDSEGVVTNESDREGDDELTDWPDHEENSAFNKGSNAKSNQRASTSGAPKPSTSQASAPKPISKKEKFLPKQGLGSCKNKTEATLPKDAEEVQLMDEDTMMSDSGSVLDTFAQNNRTVDSGSLDPSFTSFADVKNAGLLNNNVNEAFYHSFNEFQGNAEHLVDHEDGQFVSDFESHKNSSSDPSLRYCSAYAIRKIRAGCRRLRDERPGLTIHSAANEQLSKFLQDPGQEELKLPCIDDNAEEREKLASLAKLYSLEMNVELGRPVLKKTSNTTQSVCVEHTRFHCHNLLSEFKRRCYGAECSAGCMSADNSILSIDPEACGPSSGVYQQQPPFVSLAKAPTLDDLSQSQDYDQGFSSLGETPPLDPGDELK